MTTASLILYLANVTISIPFLCFVHLLYDLFSASEDYKEPEIILIVNIKHRYQHFNQYLHTADIPRISDYESSVHRLARAAQLSTSIDPPTIANDIRSVLSDTADSVYPIYR